MLEVDPIHTLSIIARVFGMCLFIAAGAMAWASCRHR